MGFSKAAWGQSVFLNLLCPLTLKRALIRLIPEGTTKPLQELLNKAPQSTFVVIDEVQTDNRGIGYETVTEIRKG